MSRLTLTYTLGAALLTLSLTGCGDDSEPPAADAAGPEVSLVVCQMTSCQAQPLPSLPCPAGTAAEFSCTRGESGRCEWASARCATVRDGGSEAAGPDDGPAAETGDAPTDAGLSDDAADGGDAAVD